MHKLSAQNVCLTTDAWTNSRGESIIAYVAASRGQAYFLESVGTGTKAHTAQWLAGDLSRVLKLYPNFDVVGVVTDSANNWPGSYNLGCFQLINICLLSGSLSHH